MTRSASKLFIVQRGLIFLLTALPLTGCFYETLPLEGLSCGDGHPCADGYACNAGSCVAESALQCDPAQVGAACTVGVGSCARQGSLTCQGSSLHCSAVAGAGADEVCDGQDNDCDGASDEDLTPPACALTQGVCAEARPACGGGSGWGSCSYGPSYEASETSCDGLDNDCDGEVDEVASCTSLRTIAGDGPPGLRDGVGTEARLALMRNMASDASGHLYVADYHNHAVRKIALDGTVTTLAGDGVCGLQDGPVANARLCYPWGIAVADDGTVYFSDAGNHRVRFIASGAVGTLAGSSGGFADGAAIGGAQFKQPTGLELQRSTGDLLIADRGNSRIRRFVKATGMVHTVAGSTEGLADGTRTSMQLKLPVSVVSDAAGNLYVSEHAHRIRKIPVSGTSSTVAGGTAGSGGPATETSAGTAVRFNLPEQLMLDEAGGVLYLADSGNFRIRKVPLDTTQSTVSVVGGSANGLRNGTGSFVRAGSVTGFVKSGNTFYFADGNGLVRKGIDGGAYSSSTVEDFVGGSADQLIADGPALTARLRRPQGIARDSAGTFYWVERESNTLRKLEGDTVTTLVGANVPGGYANGAMSTARLDNPRDVAVSPDGRRVFVVESYNNTVRVVDLEASSVATLAGPDAPGSGRAPLGHVDSSMTHEVRFSSPRAMTWGTGARANTLFVADTDNCVVRAVNPTTGATTTIAGNPHVLPATCLAPADGDRSTAEFKSVVAITSDDVGNLYVADLPTTSTTKVRKIAPDGSVQTLYDLAFAVNMLAFDGARLVATGDQSIYTLTVSAPYIQNDYFVTAFPGWRDGPASSAGSIEFYGVTVSGGDYILTDELNHRIRRLRKQP